MRWLTGIIWIAWPSLAMAAESSGDSLLPATLKVTAALGLMLGVLLVAYALSRKKLAFFAPARGSIIKIIETRYLGPKKALCVVAVHGEEFLLGVGNERIELISRLDRNQTASFEDTLKQQELQR